MSDPRKSADDAAFARELAEASRAYRAADDAGARAQPPASMDDAIRAAARRAVQSAPRPAQKPWLLRFSKPLSVAAVLVLTASLVIVMKQEQPEMVPPLPAKVGKIALPPAAPAQALEEVAPPMPASQADRMATSRAAQAVAPSAPAAAPGAGVALAPAPARAELAKPSAPMAQPFPVQVIEPAAAPVPEVRIAPPASPAPAASYAPPAAPPVVVLPAPAPPPAAVATVTANAADQARERRADRANVTSAAGAAPVALAKQEVANSAAPAPAATPPRAAGAMVAETKQALPMLRSQAAEATVATQAAPAPALKVAGAAADAAKAIELPEAWLKRIIELRKQMKAREADDELARFRKAYPDYVIPPELKAAIAR